MEPTDHDWLALCLVTESNRPEEWPAIAQVIENRRASGRWGATLKDVVLARKQFSAFNVFTAFPRDVHLGTLAMFLAMARREDVLLLMHAAGMVARGPRDDAGWSNAITRATLHYYSPVSMVPAGSSPPWAKSARQLYTPAGTDPQRFVFAEGVA